MQDENRRFDRTTKRAEIQNLFWIYRARRNGKLLRSKSLILLYIFLMPSRRFFVFARSITALHTKKTPIWRLSISNGCVSIGRMRTVGSDAVGDECKSKTYFRFTETTPGVVGKRSEPTNPAGPATRKNEPAGLILFS